MTRILRPTLPFLASLAVLVVSAYACGDDPAGPDLQDDITFLVGDWVADVLVATGIDDPQLSRDLLAEGADFGINVQPSGAYTATLTISGVPFTEIGFLSLRGDQLTFYVQFPAPDTTQGTLERISDDRVRLLGETAVDLDFDLVADPASLRTELFRQGS
jgi:hypothetical protein